MEYEGRTIDLRNRLNKHLTKLTGKQKDYFAEMKHADILDLKTVLSDVNNILTLQLTNAAFKWLCCNFNFSESVKNKYKKVIEFTKPNSKGFDISVEEPELKILAEIKCNVPIKKGDRFGTMQRVGINNDIFKLLDAKGKKFEASSYFKFLFLPKNNNTKNAVLYLLDPSRKSSDSHLQNRINRVIQNTLIYEENMKVNIDTTKVYITFIEME